VLASAILAGLSIKFSIPLKNDIKLNFDIKGGVFMSIFAMVTSYLAGTGYCMGCTQTSRKGE